MIDYSKINAWTAEKCGVYITDSLNNASPSWIYSDKKGNCITIFDEWTILDPRCREIFANKYSIEIFWASTYHKWTARKRGVINPSMWSFADNRDDVLLALIISIWKSEK